MILLLFSACSQNSTGPISKTYHNLTARYNAYFIAQVRMQEVEAALTDSYERNFNELLPVYIPIDTAVAAGLKPQLEDAMKKASLIIERHKNSKWVDNSYLLIGKARFLGGEYEKAVQTFKFLNSNTEDKAIRHHGLLLLSRTFMAMGELANAKAALDYLRKEKPEGENLLRYHKTAGELYRRREDWPAMAAHLNEAAQLATKKQGRAELYYLLGQLRQKIDQPDAAYAAYRQVLKSNPDYTLGFYARLNMAQVVNLSEGEDARDIRRYFSKLLRDRKNIEYRDKIYYELALFELRQENEKAAVKNLKKSVQASVNNPYQKALAYRKLAELSYQHAQYRQAKAWYDSTLQNLPPTLPDYEMLQERQAVLSELVTELNVLHEQDSLLQLAQLDSVSLMQLIDESLAAEQRKLEAQEAQAKANVRNSFVNQASAFDEMGTQSAGGSGAQWYFYNQSSIATGRSDFLRRWGNRPLTDFWRVASLSRENSRLSDSEQEPIVGETEQAPDPEEDRNRQRLERYAQIPRTPEHQAAALQQIETAYYLVGRIYYDKLKENQLAIAAFDSVLQRFPESEYRPEILFNLQLIYQESNPDLAARYRNELMEDYPNSTFARVAEDPDYLADNERLTDSLRQVYEHAYKFYKRGRYEKADSLLAPALRLDAQNGMGDKLYLLHSMVLGQVESKARYQYMLAQFPERFPESDLQNYAAQLLAASQNFAESQARRVGTQYIADFDQPHYFVLVYENGKKLASQLISAIDSFNLKEFKSLDLKATSLILDSKRSMVFVSQFSGPEPAKAYFRTISFAKPWAGVENVRPQYFVISRDNFQLLYDTKDPDSYQKFFEKSYK